MKNILMLDVEANGLHGEPFAAGAVVLTRDGEIIDTFSGMCPELVTNEWVKENVLPELAGLPLYNDTRSLRDDFYTFYMRYKENCETWSDVNWPVETNFLSAIVQDDPENRQWNMPYPLYDVATQYSVDIDRAKHYNEKNSQWILGDVANRKLKKHNPLDDSLASAFLLLGKGCLK